MNSKNLILILLLITAIFFAGCIEQSVEEVEEPEEVPDEIIEEEEMGTKVLLKTTMGDITIELADNMPITTGNFEKLVKEGFYNGVIFHRVIYQFMIQGGDPEGTGTGGPGYKIEDEFVEGSTNLRGTIAMANSGPNSGGSQLFINLIDNEYLDWDKEPLQSKHPAFGKVVNGMNVVVDIGAMPVGPGDKPETEIKIIEATIIE